MKHLVIFDLDGTLLNTIADLGMAVNHALAAHGYPTHPADAYPLMVGNGVRRLIERALPAECRAQQNIDLLLGEFKDYYNGHMCDATVPYAGIPELLRELRARDINLAVASNKYESATRQLVSHFFGDIDFAAVCGQVEGVLPKPDPSVVFRVLNTCPTAKADVLYCGDSGVDMETASRAGVESVGVTWGFRPVRELTSALAGHIVDEPAQIIELVK